MNKPSTYLFAAILCSAGALTAQTSPQFGVLVQHAATRTTDGHNTLTNTSVPPTPQGQVDEMHAAGAHFIRFQSSTIYTTYSGNPVYSLIGSGDDGVFTIVNKPPADPSCTSSCSNPAYYPDGTSVTKSNGTFYLNTLAQYKSNIKEILNHHYLYAAPYKLPGLVQIENEPTATNFYHGKNQANLSEQDRMDNYLAQLDAAISVIHNNFSGVAVTDGGTTSDPLCIMTWDHLYDGGANQTAADNFGKKVLHHGETSDTGKTYPDIVSWLPHMSYDYHHVGSEIGPPAGADATMYANMLQAWKNSVYLMTAYNTKSGLDYVNIHFYKKVDTTTASQYAAAFGTVIGYLRDYVVPNKTIVTTETGQYSQKADVVTEIVAKIKNINSQSDHQLPIVIWYDADGYDKTNSLTVPPFGLHWGNSGSTTGVGCLNDSGAAFIQAVTGSAATQCVINRNQ